jgi:hypothetical protein
MKAVTVLEVSDSFALSLAESALMDADIPYVIEADDPQYLPGIGGTSGIGAVPLWSCGYRIKVPADLEVRAWELLAPLQHPDRHTE